VFFAVLLYTQGTSQFFTTADTPARITDKPPSSQLLYFSSPDVTTSITSDVPAPETDTSAVETPPCTRVFLYVIEYEGTIDPTASASTSTGNTPPSAQVIVHLVTLVGKAATTGTCQGRVSTPP